MRVRRQTEHGNWGWVIDYRDGRGERHQKFSADHSEALTFANTVTSDVPAKRQGPSYTVKDLFNAYTTATQIRRGEAAARSLLGKGRAPLRTLVTVTVTGPAEAG